MWPACLEPGFALACLCEFKVVPAYCYGLEFGGCSGPEELAGEQQLSVLEHRKELEKVLIVRRLKGQVGCG